VVLCAVIQDAVDDHGRIRWRSLTAARPPNARPAFCQRHDRALRVMGLAVTYEGRAWSVFCSRGMPMPSGFASSSAAAVPQEPSRPSSAAYPCFFFASPPVDQIV
jgi:hypothetical protein